jgi:hypothetical protein
MSFIIFKQANILDEKFTCDPEEIITITKNNIKHLLPLIDKYNIKTFPIAIKKIGNKIEVYEGKKVFDLKPLSVTELAENLIYHRKETDGGVTKNKVVGETKLF